MTVNSKSTKTEIYDAYKQLEQEKANLQKQLEQAEKRIQTVNKSVSETVNKSPVIEQKTPPPPVKIMEINNNISSQYDINQIIQNLEKLQVGFGSAVSQLSEHLITEASGLEKLQQEITEEIEDLKELHNLDEIEENTLEILIETYEESAKNFVEELTQQQETLGQELEDLRKTWQKEQENKHREIQERNENQAKAKQRDEKEYQYNLQLQRQLDQETHEQNVNQLYKELDEIRKAQEKQWEEREKAIADKEKEYAEAKQKVEEFEKKLEAEIKKAKEEGKGIGNYQAKIKSDLRSKEIQGETQNYQLQIQALETAIANNETRITKLSAQLDSSLKQVQDLAVKAIEGASNRNSFDAMKEIALEQAKNQQKGK